MRKWLVRATVGVVVCLLVGLYATIAIGATMAALTLCAQGLAYVTGLPERVAGVIAFVFVVSLAFGMLWASFTDGIEL